MLTMFTLIVFTAKNKKKILTLYNKKKNNEGKKKGGENETGVSSILLG